MFFVGVACVVIGTILLNKESPRIQTGNIYDEKEKRTKEILLLLKAFEEDCKKSIEIIESTFENDLNGKNKTY